MHNTRFNPRDTPEERLAEMEARLGECAARYDDEHRLKMSYEQVINRLKQERLSFPAEIKALETTLAQKERDYEQQLQQKFQEYQQRTTQLQEVANQRRAALIQPVMDNITMIIEQLREEGAYALILDAAAGSIVSADPALDLTQEVIARLQAADAAGVGPGN